MQYSYSFLRPNYVNAVFHAIILFKFGNIFITSIKKPARPAKLGNIIVSGIKKGSSRISGERLSDFQKEVFGIPVAIAHSLQQFDFVVHPF